MGTVLNRTDIWSSWRKVLPVVLEDGELLNVWDNLMTSGETEAWGHCTTTPHFQDLGSLDHNLNSGNLKRDGRVLAPHGHFGTPVLVPSVLSFLRD